MQSAIMCPVPGFMPEQIPVRPRLIKQAVRSLFPFTDGEGERTIRPATFDQTDDMLYPRIRIPGILPSLQDKGAESQLISLLTAGQNFLFRQAVALSFFILPAQSTVITIIFTKAGKLDQTSDKYPVSEIVSCNPPGLFGSIYPVFVTIPGKQ